MNLTYTAFAVTVPAHFYLPVQPGTNHLRRTPQCPSAALLPGSVSAVFPVVLRLLTGMTA